MKQKMIFIQLISILVALPVLACALFGPPRLVVKPEVASQRDKLLAQWTRAGAMSGSATTEAE